MTNNKKEVVVKGIQGFVCDSCVYGRYEGTVCTRENGCDAELDEYYVFDEKAQQLIEKRE